MRSQVEIEAKYDLAPGDPVPDLVGVAGVESVDLLPDQELVAVYHDTEDLRLTSAGTTLRRRTGSTDDGWHLKLPLGRGERLEVHRPPGRAGSTVPKPLAALVRVHVRDARLRPVATLTTTRRVLRLLDADGAVVADVADDTVRAERHGPEASFTTWRELEIELVEGAPEQLAKLDAAVQAAGLRPAAGSSKVGRVLASEVAAPETPKLGRKSLLGDALTAHLRDLLRGLRSADPRLRAGVDGALEEFSSSVHQLLGLLDACRDRLDPTQVDRVAGPLGELARVLDEAAGAEAVATDLPSAVDGEPAELVLGPARRLVDRYVAERRRAADAALAEALSSPAYIVMLDDLDFFATHPPLSYRDERAGEALREAVRRSLAKTRKRCKEIDPAADELPTGLADVVDRLRAAAAAAGPVGSSKAVEVGTAADDLASLIGAYRRTLLLREALRLLAVQAHAANGNGFTFGRLHAQQERAGRVALRDLRKAGKALRQTPVGWLD